MPKKAPKQALPEQSIPTQPLGYRPEPGTQGWLSSLKSWWSGSSKKKESSTWVLNLSQEYQIDGAMLKPDGTVVATVATLKIDYIELTRSLDNGGHTGPGGGPEGEKSNVALCKKQPDCVKTVMLNSSEVMRILKANADRNIPGKAFNESISGATCRISYSTEKTSNLYMKATNLGSKAATAVLIAIAEAINNCTTSSLDQPFAVSNLTQQESENASGLGKKGEIEGIMVLGAFASLACISFYMYNRRASSAAPEIDRSLLNNRQTSLQTRGHLRPNSMLV